MEEITQKEIELILDNYKYYKSENILYWYMKIVKRLEYLNPMLEELIKNKLDLKDISNELFNEVNDIIEIKKLLENFKYERN
jgi:hypothetical protein